jgi:hypothetical protein
MILIKYTRADFKKYCPDYKKYTNFTNYEYDFSKAKYVLSYKNHYIIEVEFNRHQYLKWLDSSEMQDSYLAQQCWVGHIHQGGNTKQEKICIFCDLSFKGRVDAKFCSNICRSKSYRIRQREVRKKKRIMEAIEFAKFVGINEPNDKIINYINNQPGWQRNSLLSVYPKNERYKIQNRKYKKLFGVERNTELIIASCKKQFENLLD